MAAADVGLPTLCEKPISLDLAVTDDVLRHVATAGTVLEVARSEEHTSELQSLMRISYAVFCLKKKRKRTRMQSWHHYPTPMQSSARQNNKTHTSNDPQR